MRPLGELEAEVMNVVWHNAWPVTVQNVTEALGERRPLAYTTVMTIVDRLRAKGWLTREKAGRAYRAGENLALMGAAHGSRTWEEFLAERVPSADPNPARGRTASA